MDKIDIEGLKINSDFLVANSSKILISYLLLKLLNYFFMNLFILNRESFFENFLQSQSCLIKIDRLSIFDCSFFQNIFNIIQTSNKNLIFDKIFMRNIEIGINVWNINQVDREKIDSNDENFISFSDLNINNLSAGKIFYFYQLSLNELEIMRSTIFANMSSEY